MASFDKSINQCLDQMYKVGGTGKGTYGEQAVLRICESFYQRNGGILYHSYTYKTDSTKAGNIKMNQFGELVLEVLGPITEIDVLYVTQNRVFPIEVKAYKANEITLDDRGIYGCYKVDKSPIHQNEMHARHLYHSIFRALPDGDSSYIIPICVFVDRCKIIDNRSGWQRKYIIKATLDTLPKVLEALDVPGEKLIDLSVMNNVLNETCTKYERRLPLRLK